MGDSIPLSIDVTAVPDHLGPEDPCEIRRRPHDGALRWPTVHATAQAFGAAPPCPFGQDCRCRRDRFRPPLKRVSAMGRGGNNAPQRRDRAPVRQAPRHRFPRGNSAAGRQQPGSPALRDDRLRTLPPGSAPGPGRRGPKQRLRPHRRAANHRRRGVDRRCDFHPRPSKDDQGGQAQQDGDGRLVTAGGVQVRVAHPFWGEARAKPDANAITHRPLERGI